jgi:hypothetical protein
LAHIPLPSSLGIRTAGWRFDPRQQINDAEFSTARQIVGDTGAQRWDANMQFLPIKGQDASLPLKAFQAQLKGGVNSFALPAVEKAQQASFQLLGAATAFTNAANMTISGRTATKTAGAFAEDAAIVGSTGLTGGCVLIFRPGQNNRWLSVGINTDPNSSLTSASLDYSWYCRGDGLLQARESGIGRISVPTYSSRDVLAIVYDNATVRYFRNGELLRSVAAAAGLTFSLDSSFEQPGGSVTDIGFHALPAIATGASSINVHGFAAFQIPSVLPGWRGTLLHLDGRAQLVTIMNDVYADGAGIAPAPLESATLGQPYAFITDWPFAVMGLVDPVTSLSIDPGQIYSAELAVRETFK